MDCKFWIIFMSSVSAWGRGNKFENNQSNDSNDSNDNSFSDLYSKNIKNVIYSFSSLIINTQNKLSFETKSINIIKF